MRSHVEEPQGPEVLDQHAEHTPATRQLSNRPPDLRLDARGEEALELATLLVEDTECHVAGTGDLPCLVEDPLENGLGIQLGDQAPAHIEQAAQLLIVGCDGDGRCWARTSDLRLVETALSQLS